MRIYQVYARYLVPGDLFVHSEPLYTSLVPASEDDDFRTRLELDWIGLDWIGLSVECRVGPVFLNTTKLYLPLFRTLPMSTAGSKNGLMLDPPPPPFAPVSAPGGMMASGGRCCRGGENQHENKLNIYYTSCIC